MNAAFIVKLDVGDVSTLANTAADIEDDLASKGYLVISVKPWRRQGMVLPAALQPPPTQQ